MVDVAAGSRARSHDPARPRAPCTTQPRRSVAGVSYTVMSYTLMAYTLMAYTVMAYTLMAYTVIAYIVI